MNPTNHSQVAAFVLLGLSQVWELRFLFFTVFSAVYLLTVTGNLLIVAIVTSDPRLHTTMYFLLGNLSFLDFCYSSITAPRMLVDLLSNRPTISFGACLTQLFFFHFIGSTECFLYTVMSYDRYLAISYPLRYSSLMSGRVCALLAAGTWLTGSLHSAVQTTLTFRLPYCGPNQIQHYFCDAPPILKLACADTSANEMVIFVNIGVVASGCFMLIVLSYVSIVCSILRIRTSEGRHRAFQTCASHCIVVLCFFVPCVFIYLRPDSRDAVEPASSPWLDSVVQVFNNVITPSLNPLIYTLRNKDVKLALKKVRDQAAQPLGDKE
ncbi:Olfactory receptor 10G9 [Lemmus lemmus]